MNKRFLTHADIIRAEEATSAKAHQNIGKWLDKFEELINLLIKLNYYFKSDIAALSDIPEDWLFTFCNEKYLEAPYSLHVCNSLMKQGHYLNAIIQLRSLLDYYVSCRYFHENSHHIIPYCSGEKCLIDGKQQWLGTNQIYCFFSEKFYDQYYGDILSRINHGKLGPAIYRIDRSNPLKARVILIPEFNLKHSFFIINHLVPIIYGYLIHRQDFFDKRLNELPADLEKENSEAIRWLKTQYEKQAKRYPESKDWIEGMNSIIGIRS